MQEDGITKINSDIRKLQTPQFQIEIDKKKKSLLIKSTLNKKNKSHSFIINGFSKLFEIFFLIIIYSIILASCTLVIWYSFVDPLDNLEAWPIILKIAASLYILIMIFFIKSIITLNKREKILNSVKLQSKGFTLNLAKNNHSIFLPLDEIQAIKILPFNTHRKDTTPDQLVFQISHQKEVKNKMIKKDYLIILWDHEDFRQINVAKKDLTDFCSEFYPKILDVKDNFTQVKFTNIFTKDLKSKLLSRIQLRMRNFFFKKHKFLRFYMVVVWIGYITLFLIRIF
ncbi:MAG: hypothetical protein ACTSVU_07485 [Promethearchaeota archaeon]